MIGLTTLIEAPLHVMCLIGSDAVCIAGGSLFFCEDWFGHADRRKDIREKSPKEKINTLSIKPENKLLLSRSILVTNIESSNFCYLKQSYK